MSNLMLNNDLVSAEISLELGSELRSFQLNSDKNIFLETPWSNRALAKCDCIEKNEQHFLKHYFGGMQLMFPNAGYESQFNEEHLAYHGDAWNKEWRLKHIDQESISSEIYLPESNTHLERTIELKGRSIKILDLVSNVGDSELIFQLGYHPAFSEALLTKNSKVTLNAKNIEIINSPKDIHPFFISENDNKIVFSNVFVRQYSFLAIVSDFISSEILIEDENDNLLAKFKFDSVNLPHAWIWIESNCLDVEPWNSKVRTFAFEPCSSRTNKGLDFAVQNNLGFLSLDAGQTLESFFEIELFERNR